MRDLLGFGAAGAAAVMVCVAAGDVGCGGSTVSPGSDGGGSSGSSSGSASSSGGGSSSGSGSGGSSGSGSGGGSSSGGGVSPCPPTPPGSGTACTTNGAACEYGTNPNPACNEIVDCMSGTWEGSGMGMQCPTGTCPASYADVPQGQTCMPSGLDCSYPQGQCNCSFTSPSGTGTMPTWHCFTPQGCPEPRPRLGDACTQEGLSCDYGACTGGISETCAGGFWTWTMTACPG